MSDSTSNNQPARPKEIQGNEPDILDLDRVETTSGLDSINESSVRLESLTEATLKYETPKAREAREKKELAEQAHKHVVGIIRILLASVLLLGFFALGVYLFAFKSNATEAQKTYATVVLTSIVSGGVGYTFGKQEKNVSDKKSDERHQTGQELIFPALFDFSSASQTQSPRAECRPPFPPARQLVC